MLLEGPYCKFDPGWRQSWLAGADRRFNKVRLDTAECSALESQIKRLERPSRLAFNRDHVRRQVPCVITGCMANWTAPDRWSHDYLRSAIGDVEVPVWKTEGPRSVFKDDARQIVRMKFRDFLDLDHSPNARFKYLMLQRSMDATFPVLMRDVVVPDLFKRKRLFQTNFWFAPGTNVTLLHFDFFLNFLSQVTGTKRVVLYPPGAKVYPHPVHGNFAQVEIENPDMSRFPDFSHDGSLEVNLVAGEMLYIPGLWWHQVYSVPSIAVNFWWWPDGVGLLKAAATRQMSSWVCKRVLQMTQKKLSGDKTKTAAYGR